MKTHSAWIRPLALAALIASCGASQAALVTYNSQASFLAAVVAPGVDTYTGFSVSGTTPSPINRTAGAYSYTATAVGASGRFFGAGTAADPWLSTNSPLSTVLFSNFAAGVNAIGGNFFGSNLGGLFQLGDIELIATDSSGSTTQTLLSAQTTTFFGFVSTTTLQSLSVRAIQPAGGSLFPTIDNLTLAQSATQVPEPATLALVGVGLLTAACARRRA